jgi:hypothetical protein
LNLNQALKAGQKNRFAGCPAKRFLKIASS